VKVQGAYRHWQTNSIVFFNLPFDRYYMEETASPKAERTYWEHNRRGQAYRTTYASVRIWNGDAVLENLFVDDQPSAAFIQQEPK